MFHAQKTDFIITSNHFGPVLNFPLVLTLLFLVSSMPFRNGSVFICSTACSSAAVGVKLSKYGIIPLLAGNDTAW